MDYPIAHEEFLNRRKNLIRDLFISTHEKKYCIMIVGNFEDSGKFLFEQDPNFFYLTGLTAPGLILIMEVDDQKVRERIYRPTRKTESELNVHPWVLQLHQREAKYFSFVNSGRTLTSGWLTVDSPVYQELEAYLAVLKCPLFVNSSDNGSLANLWLQRCNSDFHSCIPFIYRRRQQKSEAEIKLLSQATKISNDAHRFIMQQVAKSQYATDWAVQGGFMQQIIQKGAQPSYQPIVLVGEKGYQLHGMADGTLLQKGPLLLCDVAAAFYGYHSDVTRTLPIQSLFSPVQKRYYDIVVAALDYAVSQVKPGIFLYKGETSLQAKMNQWISKNSFFKNDQERAAMRRHGIGHHVGLETHDPEIEPLQKGNVIALETGFYIQDLVNIRVENIYQVTEKGAQIVGGKLPFYLFEIEQEMSIQND